MRPLELAIEGLTSFKTPQEVDLSELDLFVITGPTGSGKSSILDAITFALYGNVARVNGRELRDLISHGSTHMRVRLDFQVDGRHYRAARRIGKNSHEATLERIENGSATTEVEQGGIRAVNDRLEEIIGLDFKAFTKAVLLPQGAFQEFLTGEVGERRRILMRLLDLGRYEAAGQAARREASRLEAVIGERGSLIESNYQDATADRRRELEKAAKQASKQYAKLEQAKDDAKAIVEQAAGEARVASGLSENTGAIEDALGELRRLAEHWPDLEAEERATQDRLDASAKALREAQKNAEQSRKKLEATIKRTGDAAALAQLDAAAATYERERAELDRLDRVLAKALKEAETKAKAFKTARTAETAVRRLVEKQGKLRERAEATKRHAEAVERCAIASAAVTELDEHLGAARDQAKTARTAAEEARKQLRHLEQEHGAALLRAGLRPGDHCPVCDAVIETLPQQEGDVDALVEAATQAAESAAEREQEERGAVVALETQRKGAADELRQARKHVPKAEAESLPAPADATAARTHAEQAFTDVLAAEQSAEEALADAAGAASAAELGAGTAKTHADGIKENRAGAETRLSAALSQLAAVFGSRLPKDLAGEIANRRALLVAAEETHRAAAEAADTARLSREKAQSTRAEYADQVGTFDQEFVGARTTARMACDAVARLLPAADLPTTPSEEGSRTDLLAEWPARCVEYTSAAQGAIQRLNKQIQSAASALQQLAEKAGVVLEASELAEIVEEFEDAATAAHGTVVAAEKDVETLTTRIAERETLEQEIADDRRLCNLHQALARELRTDHFIAFVLEESMAQLAAQASDELMQISDRRYSLGADQGSFEVVDHHNADERRSVATLSGGETFLASLSLALALSAGLRELAGTAAGRLEAIFIDEGFGALDPETLDVVVDALEQLRESDRMIGVITHVPTLADRIPVGLAVERSGSSSRILVR